MRNFTFERGRSMIEMLGVLAVIGVLSVGGIYGYKIAMNMHGANQATQLVGMIYVDIAAAATTGSQASMNPISSTNAYASVSTAGNASYPNSGIKVDFGDDVDVCKRFAQMYEGNSQFYVVAKCEN